MAIGPLEWVGPRIVFAVVMVAGDRYRVLTDRQWELLELLLPESEGRVGRNSSENRRVVEGMLYRLRTGVPWRDLPKAFGPWQTVWKRHRRYAADCTWDRVLTVLLALADTTGDLDWVVSIDSTSVRAHQPAAGARDRFTDQGGQPPTGRTAKVA
ncbi:IS5 family transposase [Nocardia africana]|uniref:IS5 family transposase n=1 Tax=Nocardia africana TaxID=134964 RepID=A0ABW6NUG8_9NOCA